jgi:hypothetical protein
MPIFRILVNIALFHRITRRRFVCAGYLFVYQKAIICIVLFISICNLISVKQTTRKYFNCCIAHFNTCHFKKNVIELHVLRKIINRNIDWHSVRYNQKPSFRKSGQ